MAWKAAPPTVTRAARMTTTSRMMASSLRSPMPASSPIVTASNGHSRVQTRAGQKRVQELSGNPHCQRLSSHASFSYRLSLISAMEPLIIRIDIGEG